MRLAMLILHHEQGQQILPRHGHEQTLRQVLADLFLEVVRLVLTRVDRIPDSRGSLPVTGNDGVEEGLELLGTLVSDADVFLQRLDRRLSEDVRKEIGQHVPLMWPACPPLRHRFDRLAMTGSEFFSMEQMDTLANSGRKSIARAGIRIVLDSQAARRRTNQTRKVWLSG